MATNDNRRVMTVADPAALATVAAERVLARIAANSGRVAICLTGGSSPKQLYQLLASDDLSRENPMAARALVHRRRTLRAGHRPAQQHGHGARDLSGSMRAGGKHPSDSDRHRRPCRSRPKRRALRAGTEIVLWRGCARSRPSPVRCRADGRRPRRPYRVAVSRRCGTGRNHALGRRRARGRMSSLSCRGLRSRCPPLPPAAKCCSRWRARTSARS